MHRVPPPTHTPREAADGEGNKVHLKFLVSSPPPPPSFRKKRQEESTKRPRSAEPQPPWGHVPEGD